MPKQNSLPAYNFDQWVKLAIEKPEQFEQLRQTLISELIASAPEVQLKKLRGLQWQIDMIREKKSNPLSVCIEINKMMWDSFITLNKKQEEILAPIKNKTNPIKITADIIPFVSKK